MGDPFVGKATSGGTVDKTIDAAEVRRALSILADPGAECELRTVKPTRSRVRKGDDLDGLVDAASKLSVAKSVYLCLNPVALGAPCESSASDTHVVGRRWLFIDIDAIRPKDVCATATEKAVAVKTAEGVRDYLSDEGWPDPVEVDSGNGHYLLYRIDLPNDEDSAALVRLCLHRLADEFPGAKIDRAVHNASRLARLPGTWNRKGDHTAERPHRLAKLTAVPDAIEVVSRDLLVKLAGRDPALEVKPQANGHGKDPFVGKSSDSQAQAYLRAALNKECIAVASAIPGDQGGSGRNNALNEAAFKMGTLLAAIQYDEAEAVGRLEEAALEAGLEQGEIAPTIQSGLSAGKKQPRKLPDWGKEPHLPDSYDLRDAPWENPVPLSEPAPPPPFPLDTFPTTIRNFVVSVANALGCPPDYPASFALAAASGAIGRSLCVAVSRSHIQPAVLYLAVVAPPASGKTPAQNLAIKPLRDEADRHMQLWRAEMEKYKQEVEKRKASKAKDEGEAEDKKPVKPKLHRLLVDNATNEALALILQDNPRGILLSRDELSGWIAGMNQYKKGGKGDDRQFWLQAWDCTSASVDRVSRHEEGPLYVPHPFVAVTGGIQPARLNAFHGDARRGENADGFLDRVLLSYPVPRPDPGEQWAEVPESVERAYAEAMFRLSRLPMSSKEDGSPTPRMVHLDSGAKRAWEDFRRQHADEVNCAEFPDFLEGVWGKMRGYCARLALVCYAMKRACDSELAWGEVDADDMGAAVALVNYFKAHARRVHSQIESDPRARLAKRIWSWVIREGRWDFKRHEVHHDIKNQSQCPRPEDLDEPLKLLESCRYIRQRPAPIRRVGRPPDPVWEVSPLAIEKEAPDI